MEQKWLALLGLVAIIIGILLYMWFARDEVARISNIEPAINYIAHGPPGTSLEEATKNAIATLIAERSPPAPARASPPGGQREEACREILEKYYGVAFPRTRTVPWLTNPETGRKLELDGYNAELGIAFEYNGLQHYSYPNHFHKTEDEFYAQKRRDIFKHEKCDANNVYLITIPYHVKNLRDFIHENLPVDHAKTPEIRAMRTYHDKLL